MSKEMYLIVGIIFAFADLIAVLVVVGIFNVQQARQIRRLKAYIEVRDKQGWGDMNAHDSIVRRNHQDVRRE